MGLGRVGRKRILVLGKKTQQTERMDVGETEVRRSRQARADVADGITARKFRQLARDMVRGDKPTLVVGLQFPITVNCLLNRIESYSGRFEKRDHHFVQERHMWLKIVGISFCHGCLALRLLTQET